MEIDVTDEQSLICPVCKTCEVEMLDDGASWDLGRFWKCENGHEFEVREIVREI